jgi:hypothetical protein
MFRYLASRVTKLAVLLHGFCKKWSSEKILNTGAIVLSRVKSNNGNENLFRRRIIRWAKNRKKHNTRNTIGVQLIL